MDWAGLLTKEDRRIYRKLNTPSKIQQFLDDEIAYNTRPATCWGPRLVLEHRAAHCMEGALFAAAALRLLGQKPLLVDLEAVRDDDHVLAVYREHGCWGAIAKSNYNGLRFRNPVYRTIRELAISYFEHYYNTRGEKTLRGFSQPIHLKRFDPIHWMSSSDELWPIPEYLCTVAHSPILPKPDLRFRMDRRLFEAGRLGMQK